MVGAGQPGHQNRALRTPRGRRLCGRVTEKDHTDLPAYGATPQLFARAAWDARHQSRLGNVERILVSSCLMGRPVRYDGGARPVDDELFERWRAEGRLVPFCPEVAGGLPVPRPPAEIVESRVRTVHGQDVTDAFLQGARLALETARRA